MRPMAEFDPTKPAMVHDRLNDQSFRWSPDLAASYRQYAAPHAPGVIEYDGRLLDGWQPVDD